MAPDLAFSGARMCPPLFRSSPCRAAHSGGLSSKCSLALLTSPASSQALISFLQECPFTFTTRPKVTLQPSALFGSLS